MSDRTRIEPNIYRSTAGEISARVKCQVTGRQPFYSFGKGETAEAKARAWIALAKVDNLEGRPVRGPETSPGPLRGVTLKRGDEWDCLATGSVGRFFVKFYETECEAEIVAGGSRLGKRRSDVYRERSLENLEIALRLHLLPFWGHLDFPEVNGTLGKQFRNQLAADGYARSTAGQWLAWASTMFQAAERDGLVHRNPVKGLRAIEPSNPLTPPSEVAREVVSLKIIKRVVEALPAVYRLAGYLALIMGLRASELRALTFRQLDFATGAIAFGRQRYDCVRSWDPHDEGGVREREWNKSSNRKPLVLPLALLEFLWWYVETFHPLFDPNDPTNAHGDDHVCINTEGRPMSDSGWYQTFDTARRVAGLAFDVIGWHFRPHVGRANTNMLLVGRVTGRARTTFLGDAPHRDLHEAPRDRAGDMADSPNYSMDVPEEAYEIAAALEEIIRDEVGDLFITDIGGVSAAAVAKILRRSEGWVQQNSERLGGSMLKLPGYGPPVLRFDADRIADLARHPVFDPAYLTTAQAAALLCRPRWEVREMCRAGEIPGAVNTPVPGWELPSWRIPRETVLDDVYGRKSSPGRTVP